MFACQSGVRPGDRTKVTEAENLKIQTVVIGAGVVGLAVARELARAGRDVIVLESGNRFGDGISSRNSEVIHAGIYYPKGSLKARLCVSGRRKLYDYCLSRQVGHRKCGKWIVATTASQQAQLAGIRSAAECNGVSLDLVEGAEVRKRMPEIRVESALWSPETGIIDSHGLMVSLLGELEDHGGQLVLHAPVLSARSGRGCHRLTVGGDSACTLVADEVVNAAGLGAPVLAKHWEGLPEGQQPDQWLARGVYFSYSGRHPFDSLIYPVPVAGGLGVHLTLDLAGQARFGPDVEWVGSEDYTVDPQRAHQFADGIRQWWPGLDVSRLQPAYAGIRPKLKGPGDGFFDFRIDGPGEHGIPGLVNLFGIESPGLTSCLSIAELVREKLA